MIKENNRNNHINKQYIYITYEVGLWRENKTWPRPWDGARLSENIC